LPYPVLSEIHPREYYPAAYLPHLLEEWPVDSDLVVPVDQLPANLRDSMGAAWRQKQRNMELSEEQEEK